jgi:hypothetical protein
VAGALAGAALAYAPWRYGQDGHLNILSTGGITLAFAMLIRGHGWSMTRGYRPERVRPRWAVAGWLVAAWQVTLGFGVGLGFVYLLALTSVCVVLGRLFGGSPALSRRLVVGDAVGGLVFVAVTAYFAYNYQHLRTQYPDTRRTWDYVAAFSPTPRALLVAPQFSLPWGTLHDDARAALGYASNEKVLLCGYALYLLAGLGLWKSVWSVVQRMFLLAGTLAGILFALGTHGPTYRALYLWAPGFDGSRTPGRLILWPTLLMAVLAAGFVTRLAHIAHRVTLPRFSKGAARVVTVPLLFLVLAEGLPDMDHPDTPTEPAAVSAAAAPFMVLPSDDGIDTNVLLWSTDGFPAMVNGAASYSTANHQSIRDVMQSFPDEASVDRLHQLGIRSIVVLRDRISGTPYEHLLNAATPAGITRRNVDGDVIFTLGGMPVSLPQDR